MMQKRELCSRITGWGLGLVAALGLFSYLTFVPSPTFAVTMPDPGELRTLSQIDTMQQMSQQICINSREHETKQLKDSRDDKLYWVTKLKDGNCWMTQNLDFDYNKNQQHQALTDWNGSIVTNTTVAWYEPGDWYYAVDNGGLGTSACGEATGPSGCGNAIFAKTGDVHYHIGNFYSWPAATIASGDGVKQATNSICPAGWQLPTSGTGGSISNTDATYSGSFEHLLRQYGWAGNTGIEPSTIGDDGIYGKPIYFFSGGRLSGGQYTDGSTYGYYWSSTPASNGTSAYDLRFGSGIVNPSAIHAYLYGMSIRCLSMGGWLDSYADPNDQANVAIVVAPVISIDVTKHADKMETDFTHVATDTITARVGSNLPYQVLISTEKSELTLSNEKKEEDATGKGDGEEVAGTTGATSVITTANDTTPSGTTSNLLSIPMLSSQYNSTGSKIVAGISSWGIGKDNDIKVTRISSIDGSSIEVNNPTITSDTLYYPVGIDPEKIPFYTSTSAATEILEFPVAIAISSTIPFGTYSTQVTLTAVAN